MSIGDARNHHRTSAQEALRGSPRSDWATGTSGSSSGPIEYRYANYDVAQAEADYRAVADEIAALQLELDLVNQTEVFSVEL